MFHIWQLALILALARICVTFELPSRQVLLLRAGRAREPVQRDRAEFGAVQRDARSGPGTRGRLPLTFLGAAGCFALNGVSYLAAIAAVFRSGCAPRRGRIITKASVVGVLLGGLRYLRQDRRIFAQFALVAFFGLVGMGYEAMIPAYATTVVQTGVRGYSVLLACGGVGATARGIRRRLARRPRAQGAADDRRHGHFRRGLAGAALVADSRCP